MVLEIIQCGLGATCVYLLYSINLKLAVEVKAPIEPPMPVGASLNREHSKHEYTLIKEDGSIVGFRHSQHPDLNEIRSGRHPGIFIKEEL